MRTVSRFSEDTKSRLLVAAGELFAERGFQGATARQICERAGVNIAAINYHFQSKEHLYVEAVKAAAPLFRAQEIGLDQKLSRLRESQDRTEAAELLAEYIRHLMRHMVAEAVPEWKVKLVLREMLEPHPGCREFFRRHIQHNFRILMGILEILLPELMPQERRIQTALSIVAQCLYYRMARDIIPYLVPSELQPKFSAEELAKHVIEFTFSALGIRRPFVERWCEEAPSGGDRSSENCGPAKSSDTG